MDTSDKTKYPTGHAEPGKKNLLIMFSEKDGHGDKVHRYIEFYYIDRYEPSTWRSYSNGVETETTKLEPRREYRLPVEGEISLPSGCELVDIGDNTLAIKPEDIGKIKFKEQPDTDTYWVRFTSVGSNSKYENYIQKSHQLYFKKILDAGLLLRKPVPVGKGTTKWCVAKKQITVYNTFGGTEYYVMNGQAFSIDGFRYIDRWNRGKSDAYLKGTMFSVDDKGFFIIDGKLYNGMDTGDIEVFKDLNTAKADAQAYSDKMKNEALGFYLVLPDGTRLGDKKIKRKQDILTQLRMQSGFYNEISRHTDTPDWLWTSNVLTIPELRSLEIHEITGKAKGKNLTRLMEGSAEFIEDCVKKVERNLSRVPFIKAFGSDMNALFTKLGDNDDFKYVLVSTTELKDELKKVAKKNIVKHKKKEDQWYGHTNEARFYYAIKTVEDLFEIYSHFSDEQMTSSNIVDIIDGAKIDLDSAGEAVYKIRQIKMEEYLKSEANENA